jgi:hypothetical protein
MQIPYDLEFIEHRPTVAVRTMVMPQPMPAWRSGRSGRRQHGADALLQWALRLLARFETSKQ